MGKTSFSGPVFGSKGILTSVGPVSASTGSSAVFYKVAVPTYEEWYATELTLFRNSTGSTNFVVSLHDDSTLLASVGVGGSSVITNALFTALTPDPGEYQGVRIAAGSTITLSHSSHAGPNINLYVAVRGYIRWLQSTSFTE
jgi:hypothetical protein